MRNMYTNTVHIHLDYVHFPLLLQEFADALMDVKKAIEEVQNSKTLKRVLGTLLSIGNFLNGREVHM